MKYFWKFLLATVLVMVGCASKSKNSADAEKLNFKDDFEKVVQIKELDTKSPTEAALSTPPENGKKGSKRKTKAAKVKEKKGKGMTGTQQRQPPIEDSEDMVGRRPMTDPFVVGEKVVYTMSYFTISAGEMSLEIYPMKEVNGRKSYHFGFNASSNSTFSLFYSVQDSAETFLEYDQMIPSTYAIHVKESKQLREVRAFWDFANKQAKVWDKRVTKEKGVEEKNEEWPLEVFAQNVFSAPFYMRTFKLYPGKKISFWVADGNENYLFKGEILRRERLRTTVGELDTVVLKPQFELKGAFRPVGDILIWMTDDDRKTIVRIESKIKIGKIVAMIKSWSRPPRPQ